MTRSAGRRDYETENEGNHMNGIEKLRNVPEQWRTGSLVDWCRSVADQIEREHKEELDAKTVTIFRLNAEIARLRADLAAAKRGLTDEAREVVERLQAIEPCDFYCSTIAKAFGVERFNLNNFDKCEELRDLLIELIECGGKQDVDVAALQGLSDKIDACASYLGHGGCADLACNMSDAAEDMFGIDEETNMADARVMLETIAERIRMAIDGAPIRGCPYYRQADHYCDAASALAHERVAAALWVEDQGGLDVVRDYPKMDEFVAKLATDLGVSDDIGCGDDLREAISEELGKRLMPQGMEWPRFEDGEKLAVDNAPEGVFSVCLGLNGECFALLDNIPVFDGTHCNMVSVAGEPIFRPEPEVLGADGLPPFCPCCGRLIRV